jgi:hypothetical protein
MSTNFSVLSSGWFGTVLAEHGSKWLEEKGIFAYTPDDDDDNDGDDTEKRNNSDFRDIDEDKQIELKGDLKSEGLFNRLDSRLFLDMTSSTRK